VRLERVRGPGERIIPALTRASRRLAGGRLAAGRPEGTNADPLAGAIGPTLARAAAERPFSRPFALIAKVVCARCADGKHANARRTAVVRFAILVLEASLAEAELANAAYTRLAAFMLPAAASVAELGVVLGCRGAGRGHIVDADYAWETARWSAGASAIIASPTDPVDALIGCRSALAIYATRTATQPLRFQTSVSVDDAMARSTITICIARAIGTAGGGRGCG